MESNYALYFLNNFNMKYFKPSKNPFLLGVKLEEAGSSPMVNNTMYRQLIGCFLYLTHTLPELSYAISADSIYMDHPHDIHVSQSQHGIKVHQSKYVSDLLKNFNMKYCKPRNIPFFSGVKLEEAGSSPLVNHIV